MQRKGIVVLCLSFAVVLCSGAVWAKEARIVVGFGFQDAREFSEGLAAVRSNDLWGYIDATGRLAVPLSIEAPETGPFSGGFAFTGRSFIDTAGEPAFEGKTFERAGPFSEGLAAVQSGGQWGYINLSGRFVIPSAYEGAGPFSGGLAAVRRDGLWGYADTQGRMLIGPRFTRAAPFGGEKKNLAAVELGGRTGYIDRTGRFVIPPRYEEAGTFRGSRAPVRLASRRGWGYIDPAGREVIPARFHEAGTFSDGLAPVATDARWGYIDERGRLVLDAGYDEARPFSEGLAAVQRDGKWGYIRAGTALDSR
jgi:hypothetical protein